MTVTEQEERRRELATTRDPRAAQTRGRIIDALDEVLVSGEAPTVAALCTAAGIGRSTFYTHFRTVADVVVHVVDAMFDEVAARDAARRAVPGDSRAAITEQGIREFLTFLDARRQLFRYALSAPATERVHERFVGEMARSIQATLRTERPDADDEFFRSAGEYIAGGVIALLLGWVADSRGRGADDIVVVAMELLPGWLTTDPAAGSGPTGGDVQD